jgi:hypothetical protein
MSTQSKPYIVERRGSSIHLTAFMEVPPKKPHVQFERDEGATVPADTIAFKLVRESAGDDLLRSVTHLEPNVPTTVTKVQITDDAGQHAIVPITLPKTTNKGA